MHAGSSPEGVSKFTVRIKAWLRKEKKMKGIFLCIQKRVSRTEPDPLWLTPCYINILYKTIKHWRQVILICSRNTIQRKLLFVIMHIRSPHQSMETQLTLFETSVMAERLRAPDSSTGVWSAGCGFGSRSWHLLNWRGSAFCSTGQALNWWYPSLYSYGLWKG